MRGSYHAPMQAEVEYWAPGRAGRARSVELARRGVRHGHVSLESRGAAEDLTDPVLRTNLATLWGDAYPIHLPRALEARLRGRRGDVRATLALFERLRRGGSFQDELWARLDGRGDFAPAGATIDTGDEREIEKVFADRLRGGRRVARDLYAKLSWIAADERDDSLRLRFSFGSEALCEWQAETRRAPHAEAFAEAVFPECDVLTAHAALVRLVGALIGRAPRFGERIVYNNAPGGGAIFHHDVEPHQLGVLYGQLAGETGWLALPRELLANEIAAALSIRPKRALARLEREDDAELTQLLNHTPAFTRALVLRGSFVHLRAGDALILPSPTPEVTCWHSVFALGARPSLAHSYGIFARRR
jgi:hypothetical protein